MIAVFTKHGITLQSRTNQLVHSKNECRNLTECDRNENQYGDVHNRKVNKDICCFKKKILIIWSCLMYDKYRTDRGVTRPSFFHLLVHIALNFSLRAERWNNYGLVTPWSVLSINPLKDRQHHRAAD